MADENTTRAATAVRTSRPWSGRLGLGLLIGLLAGALAMGGFGLLQQKKQPTPPAVGTTAATTASEVIMSVQTEQQVVLLSLAIQGIEQRTQQGTVLGVRVPGSDREKYLQYAFKAKLGVEGRDVAVTSSSQHNYAVTVPKFIFIGYEQPTFKLIAENNGVLSRVTPKIDEVGMVDAILNSNAKQQYIEDNRQQLKDQTRAYYGGIIKAIDPQATVTYTYDER